MNNRKPKVGIIGAGPAGLAMARALKRLDIDYVQFEKHSGFGGIWDIENLGSPMYKSAHFISSRQSSAYYHFPMSKDCAEYPTREQVLQYTRRFAEHFDLVADVKFSNKIESAEPHADGWRVTTESGADYYFSHLVCANGNTWDPNWPHYAGVFEGKEMHSVDYKSPAIFKGQRVLVVGAGNSACDIACDAAASADQAFISMRRGYHFVPKHIFGKPADEFGERSRFLPFKLRQLLFGRLLKLINGDLSKYGLRKPDHKVFESHPIINSQLLHYLSHGDIKVCDDIAELKGKQVVFKDGHTQDVDLVVYATGYHYSIPYIDPSNFEWQHNKPLLAHSVFNAKHDTLFAIGFTEMNSGGYYLFDEMSGLIAQAIKTQHYKATRWEQIKPILHSKTDFSGGINFIESSRHQNYLDVETFLKSTMKLVNKVGWVQAKTLVAG